MFCEEPLSNELSVVGECLREVDKAGVRLMIGFQRRFDANFRRVRNLVRAGAVGTVRMFTWCRGSPRRPQSSTWKRVVAFSYDYDWI